MDCSLPGSSVHGIFQARVLEWVAISFCRGSARLRDQTWVSHIVGRCFYHLSHEGSPLSAEFQRIARRDNKAFFSGHCKKIKKNNRTGKTRDLFKKIGDIKGTFHAKIGTIKNRNGKDLIEAEETEKSWQKCTEQ